MRLLIGCFITMFIWNCNVTDKRDCCIGNIDITDYQNTYNQEGKLVYVKYKTMSNVILNGKNVHAYISDTGKYCNEYQNDTVYTLTRVSDSLRESEIIRKDGRVEETIRLKSKDTIYHQLCCYNLYGKLSYSRLMSKELEDTVLEETNYYYDQYGNQIKYQTHDWISGEKDETYLFYNLSYEKAVKHVPVSIANKSIICFDSVKVQDTVVIKRYIDGEIDNIIKNWQTKEKEYILDINRKGEELLRQVKYKENGVDINVVRFRNRITDSIFSIDDLEVKRVSSEQMFRTVTLMEYDNKGNITKKISKMRHLVKEKY